ncbi:MAG: hypothetical protein JJU37_16705 [Balneolaceae bacterium]|nr:hypothetical protein [Balneolaceae bacterium]
MMQLILAANLFSTFLLCGLIWTVQLVHYPMFHRLDKEKFGEHIRFHGFRISILVIPMMITELVTSFSLAFFYQTDHTLHLLGFSIVVLIWLVTFFIQVPIHSKLASGYDSKIVTRLVRSNSIRTVLWSLKAIMGLYILFGS